MRPGDDISDRPRSPIPYCRQMGGLQKRIEPEKTSLRGELTTSNMAIPAHEVTGAA